MHMVQDKDTLVKGDMVQSLHCMASVKGVHGL